MRSKTKTISRTCLPFDTLKDARSCAKMMSEDERDIRYVIHTGDVFFVSTTADIQNYEILVAHFEKGAEVYHKLVEQDDMRRKVGEQKYNNKYKTTATLD